MGGGAAPWGRRYSAGIHFSRHPEEVKLQQCHMQNTIFELPNTTGSILFFFWEGECQYILETATGELEGKMGMTIQ